MMSQVEVTQIQRAGASLRRVGPVTIDTDQIVARMELEQYAVLYLRSGEKLLVKEPLEEIERLRALTQTQRDVMKRFKREIRECKAIGMSVENAFAALWEEISIRARLSEGEQAELFQQLLAWTKRWLK